MAVEIIEEWFENRNWITATAWSKEPVAGVLMDLFMPFCGGAVLLYLFYFLILPADLGYWQMVILSFGVLVAGAFGGALLAAGFALGIVALAFILQFVFYVFTAPLRWGP